MSSATESWVLHRWLLSQVGLIRSHALPNFPFLTVGRAKFHFFNWSLKITESFRTICDLNWTHGSGAFYKHAISQLKAFTDPIACCSSRSPDGRSLEMAWGARANRACVQLAPRGIAKRTALCGTCPRSTSRFHRLCLLKLQTQTKWCLLGALQLFLVALWVT